MLINFMTKHAKISYVKSLVRMVGFLLLINNLFLSALVLIIAEGIGILEELYESK